MIYVYHVYIHMYTHTCDERNMHVYTHLCVASLAHACKAFVFVSPADCCATVVMSRGQGWPCFDSPINL